MFWQCARVVFSSSYFSFSLPLPFPLHSHLSRAQLLNVFNMDTAQLPLNCGIMVLMFVSLRFLGLFAFKFVSHVKR